MINRSELAKKSEIAIQILIVLSLVAFSIQTLPNLSDRTHAFLNAFEVVSIAIFTCEYVVRLYYSKSKAGFIFSFFGLVDLLAILPFFISQSYFDGRSFRIVRLFRLIRILKLVRYSQAMQRFHRAIVIAKEEIILFSTVTVLLMYLSAVGIYFFEHKAQPEAFASVFHSLWWAVATLTTVGYGDVYPITPGGKIFTFFLLLVGLGIVSVPAGLVSSALTKARIVEFEDDADDDN